MSLPEQFGTALCQNFEDGILFDFTIKCAGKSIPVHKIVISSYSEVFKAACLSSFQEGTCAEYEIPDFEFGVVLGMVRYMYVGFLDRGSGACTPLGYLAAVAALSDKYLIKTLKDSAMNIFTDDFEDDPQVVENDELLAAIPEVYTFEFDGAEVLRKTLVKEVKRRIHESEMDDISRKDWLAALSDTPQFCVELLEAYIGAQGIMED